MSKYQIELEIKKPDSLKETKAQLALGTYDMWWVELCDHTYVSPWGGCNIDILFKRFRGALNKDIPAYEMLGYTTYICIASEFQMINVKERIHRVLADIAYKEKLQKYGEISFKYEKTTASAEVLQCLSE